MTGNLIAFCAFAFVTVYAGNVANGQDAAGSDLDPPPPPADSAPPSSVPVGASFQLGGDQAIPMPETTLSGRSLKSESFFSSPTGALLKSVAFPGWGQLANGKRQKAAVYFGIESYWIAKSLIWRHRARTAASLADFSHAQDRRNYFYWLTGITVFVSMFDAYTDRYMLTLERTRDEGDDFWGNADYLDSAERWQLALTIKF